VRGDGRGPSHDTEEKKTEGFYEKYVDFDGQTYAVGGLKMPVSKARRQRSDWLPQYLYVQYICSVGYIRYTIVCIGTRFKS